MRIVVSRKCFDYFSTINCTRECIYFYNIKHLLLLFYRNAAISIERIGILDGKSSRGLLAADTIRNPLTTTYHSRNFIHWPADKFSLALLRNFHTPEYTLQSLDLTRKIYSFARRNSRVYTWKRGSADKIRSPDRSQFNELFTEKENTE